MHIYSDPKLKLNKVVRRHGRPKGTKKTFMDFSKSEKDKSKITHKRKANSDSKSQKKVRKTIKEVHVTLVPDADITADADVSLNTQQVTSWVNGLNISDKMALQCDQWLNDKHIDTAQCLIKNQFFWYKRPSKSSSSIPKDIKYSKG